MADARTFSDEDFVRAYGGFDPTIEERLSQTFGENLSVHASLVRQFGITRITGLFNDEHIAEMREDMASWLRTKSWSQDGHISFDGNSGEAFLPTSEALSAAVANPVLLALVASSFGQHPHLSFVRAYSIAPVPHYKRRAFQWHHDGYGEFGFKAMILLSPVPAGGQAMIFCPGTHKIRWPTATSRETQFSESFAEQFAQYVCSGQAGDVFLFNPHALHRGHRNQSAQRDVIVANFQPGIARNYPLPGLHPAVVEALSPYERAVYRTDGERLLDIDEVGVDEFERLVLADREQLRALADSWSPARASAPLAKVDRDIVEAGSRNASLLEQGVVSIQNAEVVTAESVAVFREWLAVNGAALATAVGTPELLPSEAMTRILGEWETDLQGDLDLPIRMYHPTRDQRRDNAITQTRDNPTCPHRSAVAVQFAAMRREDLTTGDLSAIPNSLEAAVTTIEARQRRGTRSPKDAREFDSYACLVEDLDEMLKRAHSCNDAIEILLYAALALTRLAQLDGASELEAHGHRALVDYAALKLAAALDTVTVV